MHKMLLASLIGCGAVYLWATPGVTLAETIGAAAAVKPAATGTPPGGSARTLSVGSDIAERERIVTGESGSVQVMFLDKSTLMVGQNSDLVIDEFVYDPNIGTGKFSAKLAIGALRFVGGQISHSTGVTISTPTATVGIRGGLVNLNQKADSLTVMNQSPIPAEVIPSDGSPPFQVKQDQIAEVGPNGVSIQFLISVDPSNLGEGTASGQGDGDSGSDQLDNADSQSDIENFVPAQEPPPPPSPAPEPQP